MKVTIENSPPGCAYRKMFEERGWAVSGVIDDDTDLVLFTGGSDVDPSLYGEQPHPHTHFNIHRDEEDIRLLLQADERGLPTAGICRGGQFLNVMRGGSLFQHVNNHGVMAGHILTDTVTGELVEVSSTHHQMMDAGDGGQVRAVASESTRKEWIEGWNKVCVDQSTGNDREVVIYPDKNTLCFQPHPEFFGKDHPCNHYFFKLLQEVLQ